MRQVVSSLVLGLVAAWSSSAWAATEAADTKSEGSESAAPAPEAKADAKDTAAADKDPAAVADAEAGSSPVEVPGKTYMFVGARYRAIILPQFMMSLFGDGGKTVLVHGFGPELGIRRNGFEYNLSIWYASYSMGDTAFKGKSDGPDAWEIVSSDLSSIFLTSDFLWSQEFTPELSLNYGVAGGLGIIFGDLHRVEAMRGPGADPNTGAGYVRCTGPTGGDCGPSNHYGNYTEPSWTDGGSKPILFPWFVLQTGLRYKPHKNFAGRFDFGFGTSGFFLGLGLDYGL